MLTATKPAYKMTVRDFHLSFIDKATGAYEKEGGSSTAAKVYNLPIIKTFQLAPDASSKKIYASGATYDVANRVKGATGTLGAIALPREITDKGVGSTASNGMSIDKVSDGSGAQEFGCGYSMDMSDGSEVYFWYPRCKLTLSSEDYNDQGDSDIDPNTSYTIEMLPTDEGVWRMRYYTKDVASGKTPLTIDQFFGAPSMTVAEITALVEKEGTATQTAAE